MSYEVNGVKYDSWSAKNQRIIDMLVNREVYCCMTSEVEYMISRIPFNDDNNPFEESDYDQMMVPYCSECESSYGFEEITVAELKDDAFATGEGLNEETDELEDGFLCPVCEHWHKTIAEARKCCGEDATVYRCQNCDKVISEDEHENLDTKPEEIYEWWAVTNWFGEKLKEQGCVVIEAWGKSYWGRCTTGQSISLDGCIVNIAKSMQILDGMENEWSA